MEVLPKGCETDCLRSADLESVGSLADRLLAGSARFSGENEKLANSNEGLRAFRSGLELEENEVLRGGPGEVDDAVESCDATVSPLESLAVVVEPLLVPGRVDGRLLPPTKIEPFLEKSPPSCELEAVALCIFRYSRYAEHGLE